MSLTCASSPHTVAATIERILGELASRGIHIFACIDHAAGARAAGLDLNDEVVVIFGDPRAGTPLMQSDATIGYELPLRLLVWDADGQTKIAYRPPTELAAGYEVAEREAILARMNELLEELVAKARA